MMSKAGYYRRWWVLCLGLMGPVPAIFGFDSYQIDIPANVMKGDPDVFFTVTPYAGATPDPVPHNVVITLPSGVTESPLADAPSGLDWSSVGSWGLFASNSASPGSVPITVTEALAAVPVTTTKNFNLQNVVRSFEIVPPGAFTGTTGTSFTITIRARDGLGGGGAVVTGFNDNVIVSASTGDVVVNGSGNVVSGSDFVSGEATVSVMLRGTNPDTRTNRITVTASINYFSLGLATGYADVNMNPGDYDHVVLLFPGETLAPGRILIASGKTGTPTSVTANVAVAAVRAYLVDQFNNPILTPASPVTLSFDSLSYPGMPRPPNDTVPGNKVINVGNTVLVNGEFVFYRAGETHQVRVYDLDAPAKESQSGVFVNSGAPNLIEVSAIASPQLPGRSFTVSARVVDGTPANNTVTSYPNSRPVTLTLTNCAGGSLGAGSLDANPVTAGIQTTVTFTAGVFSGPIVVYPKTPSACVKFDDGLGNFGESPSFQISLGDEFHLHVVMPGQTFTPGQYPGNSPATPTTQIAGALISADVYVVDQGWNVVDNVTGGWAPDSVVMSLANTAGTPGYVDLTVASPVMPASGNHATATGVRLRTAYPGADGRLVANMSGLTGRSDAFTINPAAYSQMVFVAPGETLAPGIQSSIEPDGKTGLPTDQAVNTNVLISVYLTDDYFNTIINPPLAGSAWPSLTFSSIAPPSATVTFSFTNPFPMTSGLFSQQVVFGTIGANTLRVVDTSPTPKSKNQTINVTPGSVTRFLVTPNSASTSADSISIQTAGVPFNLTFKAFDVNDNIATNFSGTVSLELWEDSAPLGYAGTITPTSVNFVAHPVTGGVVADVPITITYAGKSLGAGADNLRVRAFVTSPTMREGFSAYFSVQENSTWSDVVLTLPGETRRPGLGAPYKTGSPSSALAGNTFLMTLTAVDTYGNRVDQSGVADLSLLTAGVSANLGTPAQITFANGLGTGTGQIYTSGASVIRATVTATGFSDTSNAATTVGSYAVSTGRLVLLAPGETLVPGSTSAPGKDSSAILDVEANTAMTFQLRACDRFYNVDTSYSGTGFTLTSDDAAISRTGISILNGVGSVSGVYLKGHLPNPSLVEVTAADSGDGSKNSLSNVTVTPGAAYEITVPTGAAVGVGFSMTVELIDPDTGLPMVGANNAIAMEAINLSGDPATVPIGVAVATLVNGSVTLTQSYSYVEPIRIRVTDAFNRLSDSGTVVVVPNGLKYKVTLPASSKKAGELFNVTVGLYDTVQDALPIQGSSYQHTFNVWVEAGGLPGVGTTPLTEATLSNGESTFNFSYTKAEHIVVRASGTVTGFGAITGLDDMDIVAGDYVKLQILAPGENPLAGIPSATGKDSSGLLTQAAGEPFSIIVNGVDAYWNIVTTLNTHLSPSVILSASDGSLVGLSTQAYAAGTSLFAGTELATPPSVTVTASDTASPSLVPQSVDVPLSGRRYVAAASSAWPEFYSGPPRAFDVDLTLYRYSGGSTGTIVSGFAGNVYIEPFTPSLTALPVSNLVVVSPALPDPAVTNMVHMDPSGVLNLTLGYRVAEDIVLKFYDDSGWQGFSDPISLVPREVDYAVTVPAEAAVGPPDTFSMSVAPRDRDTGTTAKNWSQTVTLTPVSPTAATIFGTLQVSSVLVSGGTTTFQQGFSQAGVFYFNASDGVRTSSSAAMNFLPGALSSMTSDMPATVEAGSTRTVTVTLLDAFSNPIPNLAVEFSLGDSSLGTLSTLSGTTNVLGQSSTLYTVDSQKSGAGEWTAVSGSVRLRQFFRVLGPPTTSVRVDDLGVEQSKGFSIKPTDRVFVDVAVASGTTLVSLVYSLDGGPTVTVPAASLTLLASGVYTYSVPGITAVGEHTLEFYGVTQTPSLGVHQETVKASKTIYVSYMTTAEDGLLNYPNPFRAGREVTFLEYQLDADAGVSMTIFDRLGQQVWQKSFSQGEDGGRAGLNRVAWDGRNGEGVVVGNGGYVAVLESTRGPVLRRKIAVRK